MVLNNTKQKTNRAEVLNTTQMNAKKLQATEAKQQRDEARDLVQLLKDKLEQLSSGQNGSIAIPKDLRGLSIQKLKTIQVNFKR